MARYAKKVVTVEAVQNRGNFQELVDWLHSPEVVNQWLEAELRYYSADDGSWVIQSVTADTAQGILVGDYLTCTEEGFMIGAPAQLFEHAFELIV